MTPATVNAITDIPEEIHLSVLGKVSGSGWSCAALAEVEEGGTVITADNTLKNVYYDRDVEVCWETRFMLQISISCVISQSEYDD